MSSKKAKSLNSQIYTYACKRLKLKRREKIIFYRLLGFLIRNDKPFPYSIKSLAEITGYSESPIYEALNILEKLRLIERVGYTSRVKFQKGSILKKIYTLVQKRINIELYNKLTLVRVPDKIAPTSPDSGYQKTSSSLKHNKGGVFSQSEIQQIEWYKRNPHIRIAKDDMYLFDS